MIINCNIGLFVKGLEPDIDIILLRDGKSKEYTKKSIPRKYLDLTACIIKLDNGYLFSIY